MKHYASKSYQGNVIQDGRNQFGRRHQPLLKLGSMKIMTLNSHPQKRVSSPTQSACDETNIYIYIYQLIIFCASKMLILFLTIQNHHIQVLEWKAKTGFKSLGESFTHIYTQIKLKQNFYLIKKKKSPHASYIQHTSAY